MALTRPLIVASSSPRRQYLMKEAAFTFTVEKPDVDESFPEDLPVDQVAHTLPPRRLFFLPRQHLCESEVLVYKRSTEESRGVFQQVPRQIDFPIIN